MDEVEIGTNAETDVILDELDSSQNEHAMAEQDEKPLPNNSPKYQNDMTSLIASKISELEKENTKDEEEEKEIARAVKAEHRKLSTLVSETDTEIGKVTLLQRKYTTLFQDMQRLEREHTRQKAKSEKSTKEINTSKLELNKAVNMKHKLETLCRELQKENKRVKEESKRLAQSEQQKRVDLNNKFETTILEIKTKMDEDSGLVGKRRLEDNDLKDKFKSFLEQYEVREQHFYGVLRAKELESQLSQARLDQFRKTSENNEQRARTLHSQVSTFSETESELRSQLNIYVEKFKQVEDTLNNSNDLFLNFRKEMETMTKKTKKSEKDNILLRSKCDTANKSILEMAEERAKYRKENEFLKNKNTKLENLCRALQHERVHTKSKPENTATEAPTTNGQKPELEIREASIDQKDHRNDTQQEHDMSDGSVDDDYSETSFEVSDPIGAPPQHPLPSNPIAGFLKVTGEEEKLIREKRLEYGQETHSSPDHDRDGYLAVSSLEKDYIGAMRDSKLLQNQIVRTVAESAPSLSIAESNAEISGKFNLFQKMFSGAIPRITTLQGDAIDEARNGLSTEERRLYDEAAERLANMSKKFANRETGQGRSPEGSDDVDARSMDKHTQQLTAFKKQMTPEKLKDFSKQYDDMLNACKSLVTCPQAAQTYEALMTSVAILLSDRDLAELKTLYEQSRQGV